MMTIIELLLAQTKQGKKELARQELIVNVTEQIWAAMEDAGITKADLARNLETSKANITQMLNGRRNMTLATLADIAAALDLKPCVYLAGQNSIALNHEQVIREIHGVRVVGTQRALASKSSSQNFHFSSPLHFDKIATTSANAFIGV